MYSGGCRDHGQRSCPSGPATGPRSAAVTADLPPDPHSPACRQRHHPGHRHPGHRVAQPRDLVVLIGDQPGGGGECFVCCVLLVTEQPDRQAQPRHVGCRPDPRRANRHVALASRDLAATAHRHGDNADEDRDSCCEQDEVHNQMVPWQERWLHHPSRTQALTPWSRSTSLSVVLSCRSPAWSRLSTSTHGIPNSPPGKERLRVPLTHTDQAGASPRGSSSPDCTSMMCVVGVRIVPAPRTAPARTLAPLTTIDREPMNASSSTTTGTALGGSRTPPMPTPPDRWTFLPICAQEPTVAHVSTIVPESTNAPMLTKEGMSTAPGAM